jgi:hypothetical protein
VESASPALRPYRRLTARGKTANVVNVAIARERPDRKTRRVSWRVFVSSRSVDRDAEKLNFAPESS